MSTATHEQAVVTTPAAGAFELDSCTAGRPSPGTSATPAWPRKILVASDGSPEAEVAIDAARDVEDRTGASVAMVAVYSPRIPVPRAGGRPGFEQCEPTDRGGAAELLLAVRRQRHRLLRNRHWPLSLDVGDPCTVIVRLAREMRADLVVLGIGPQNPEDRWLDVRTAVSVAQYLDAALYAVAPGSDERSTAVVVAPGGLVHAPTLRAAAACVRPSGRICLAVSQRDMVTEAVDSVSAHDLIARACGDRFAEQFDELTLERVDVEGELVGAVLRVAKDRQAQLIAIPMHGDPGPVRAFLPNLADSFLLAARCSVLVVPDPTVRTEETIQR